MFSKAVHWAVLQRQHTAAATNPLLRAGSMAGVLALACLAFPASARTPYDGDWSVVIVTRQGACDAAFRYGIAIDNGIVGARDSSAATVQGRVAPSGAVNVSVRSGNSWAGGSGRLGRDSGGGVWRGQGSRGACSGTWQATRQSAGPYAGEPGRGRYYYGGPGT